AEKLSPFHLYEVQATEERLESHGQGALAKERLAFRQGSMGSSLQMMDKPAKNRESSDRQGM
ncbi:MAG TPA: hypothetical protein VLN47_02705, partial [Clostridiaceae bacterium]|nr:hypothetical protein [Clostridiaceae bacterium]